MENNENDNFVSLLADSTFKYMFKDYRDFFKKVIKSTTNVDISEYEAELEEYMNDYFNN